jgi:hypothetical protein
MSTEGGLHQISEAIGQLSATTSELLRQNQGMFRKLDEMRDAMVASGAKTDMALALLRQDHEALHDMVHRDLAPKVERHDDLIQQGKGMSSLAKGAYSILGVGGVGAVLHYLFPTMFRGG